MVNRLAGPTLKHTRTFISALQPASTHTCVFVPLLTGEVDWLLQMHHGDVGLFGPSVVLLIEDDAIDLSGLNSL